MQGLSQRGKKVSGKKKVQTGHQSVDEKRKGRPHQKPRYISLNFLLVGGGRKRGFWGGGGFVVGEGG